MSDVPFNVMMRGPAAVAAWLDAEEREFDRKRRRLIETHLAVLKVCGLSADNADKIDAETLAMGLGACLQSAAIIMYATKGGMRGPARDALSEGLDATFDDIDALEEASPHIAALIKALRSAS